MRLGGKPVGLRTLKIAPDAPDALDMTGEKSVELGTLKIALDAPDVPDVLDALDAPGRQSQWDQGLSK